MQIKLIKSILLIFLATAVFAQQEKNEKPAVSKNQESLSTEVSSAIPVQSKYSNNFKIDYISFNKNVDLTGKGETIEFDFVIKNNLDDPQELYIWTIATFEKIETTRSSFEAPIEEKDRMLNFIPFPDNIKSFEYSDKKKSNDVSGKNKTILIKHPKDPKNGVNPVTNKAYILKDKLLVKTKHLSKYRNNYTFFNNFTLLIFDKDGNLVFRQLYDIKYRRK